MFSEDYGYDVPQDDHADAQQQLAEYEQYVLEQNEKARALLSLPAAHPNAHKIAENLAVLVHEHAIVDEGGESGTALEDMLKDTIAEHVLTRALQGREEVLTRRVGREGFIALREALERGCLALEILLGAT